MTSLPRGAVLREVPAEHAVVIDGAIIGVWEGAPGLALAGEGGVLVAGGGLWVNHTIRWTIGEFRDQGDANVFNL
jgi:hypothetical protein